MSTARILWVDLSLRPNGPGLPRLVAGDHAVERVRDATMIQQAVYAMRPDLVCVEFDYPDEDRLRVLPAIRRDFPELPLLVFTEYHSEALAIRVFRWGVWDYRVKPVSKSIMLRSIEFAVGVSVHAERGRGGGLPMPSRLAVPEAHLLAPVATTLRTARVVAHISTHYAQELRRGSMAAICHLSESEFSRMFRREHERTFERFLLEFRIGKARELLVETTLTITQVAHAVGFNDSSYFARIFRKLSGVSASSWRDHARTPRSTTG